LRFKSLDLISNPVAINIRRTFSVTISTATILAASTIVSTGAWAHSRHHHHQSQSATPTPAKHTSPVDVAGNYGHNAAISLAGDVNRLRSTMIVAANTPDTSIETKYAHTAAIQLASHVNQTRAAVQPTHKVAASHESSHHAIRLARHEERMAMRAEHHRQRQVRVAQQDVAIRSGDVVSAAYSFRGTRYVFGGTSRSGFDCSSFVRYILGRADGVDLPRTAEEQYYHGSPVSREDLRPGDLVFFKNTYRHGISHVGIYTGNGKFVHAANSHKGVREDSLDTNYYLNHYAGARRVIGMR